MLQRPIQALTARFPKLITPLRWMHRRWKRLTTMLFAEPSMVRAVEKMFEAGFARGGAGFHHRLAWITSGAPARKFTRFNVARIAWRGTLS